MREDLYDKKALPKGLLQQYNQSGYFPMSFTMLAGFLIIVGTLAVFMGLVLNVISKVLIEKEKT